MVTVSLKKKLIQNIIAHCPAMLSLIPVAVEILT
jgi:hypothetical protein